MRSLKWSALNRIRYKVFEEGLPCMGIVASDVSRLAGDEKKDGRRFSSDFYGRFSELDLDSVEEVREIRER